MTLAWLGDLNCYMDSSLEHPGMERRTLFRADAQRNLFIAHEWNE